MNNTVPLQVAGGPLTSYNETQFMDGCTLDNTATNKTFRHVYTYTQYTLNNPELSDDWYDILNWLVAPVLLTFMPIANSEARASIGTAKSKMLCVHANTVNPGNDQPGLAPTPTPVDFSSGGLSGGAIAGIVVGIIAVLAIIAGLAFFFWRRKRKTRKEEEKNIAMPAHHDQPPAYSSDAKTQIEGEPLVEAPADDAGIKELDNQNEVRPELQNYKSQERVELAADGTTPKVERQPAELFAGAPDGDGKGTVINR